MKHSGWEKRHRVKMSFCEKARRRKLSPEDKEIVNRVLKMIEEVMNMRYRVFLYDVPEEIEAPDKETAEATLMELLSKAFWLLEVTEYSSAKQRSDGQENKVSEGAGRAG